MSEVHYTELIVACESCGNVQKFTVSNQADAEKIFKGFRCENGCGRNLYSFITLGTLARESLEQDSDTADEK